jgi:hypothetical protein
MISQARLVMGAIFLGLVAGSGALWAAYSAELPIGFSGWLNIAWCPTGFAVIWAWGEFGGTWFERNMAEKQLTVTPSHRRHNHTALVFVIALVVSCQATMLGMAWGMLGPDNGETARRILLAFVGAGILVLGDRYAKLQTPYRDGAVEPPNFGRAQRIAGWGMVITGLVIIPCALLLPLIPVACSVLAYFTAAAALLLVLHVRRKRLT